MDKTTPLAPLRTFLEAKGSPLFEIIIYLMVASKIARSLPPGSGVPDPTRWTTWVSSQRGVEVRTCCQERSRQRRCCAVYTARVLLRATSRAATTGSSRTRGVRERSPAAESIQGKGRTSWSKVPQRPQHKTRPSAFLLVLRLVRAAR